MACPSCPGARLVIKPLYTVAELAKMAEVDTRRMRRILRRNGVQLQRETGGRNYLVPLIELERKLSWLRESMATRDLHLDVAAAGYVSRF
jgi:phage antirepressor YoqD-like protein